MALEPIIHVSKYVSNSIDPFVNFSLLFIDLIIIIGLFKNSD